MLNIYIRKPSKTKTRSGETREVYQSAKQASLKLGLSRNAVSLCCRGYSKTCGGLHWEYCNEGVA